MSKGGSQALEFLKDCQLFPRRRQWHPTPVLLPGESHGRRSLVGCSPWGREESDTTERLQFHFSFSCIGEGNGNPLQCSYLENPRDGGAWWAAVYGVTQSQTWLKWLSSFFQWSAKFGKQQFRDSIDTFFSVYFNKIGSSQSLWGHTKQQQQKTATVREGHYLNSGANSMHEHLGKHYYI